MTSETSRINAAFDRLINPKLRALNTCLPAVVETYDTETKTMSGSIAIPDFIEGDDGEPVEDFWPKLEDIPVIFPGGGGGFHRFAPLKKGDLGLIIFAQRSIAKWWTSDGKEPTSSEKLQNHPESAGFFLPLVYTLKQNKGKPHAENLVEEHENGKYRREVTPNAVESIKLKRLNVGSDDAAKALALAQATLDALNELKDTVNQICVNSAAAGGLIIPPVSPIISNWAIDNKKIFVSE